jgi:hypothetical protein
MTTITFTGHSDTARRQTSLRSVIACFFEDIFAGAREGREIEARYHELRRKSPTELTRLGLTPAEITRAAANGRIV